MILIASACGVLQAELAVRAGRISELEQGAVSREQFEELQKELQDQRLEIRLAHTRCEELQQHCEELVRALLNFSHSHSAHWRLMSTVYTTP